MHLRRRMQHERSQGHPVFVFGCPRSGTTLLRLMLDAHPDLAIPPESHFIPRVWAVRQRYEKPEGLDVERLARDIMATQRVRDWRLSPEDLWARLRNLEEPDLAGVFASFFQAYADAQGKVRWGDKTPGYSLEIPLLLELFPDARFVHLIRDGRNVALSFMALDSATNRLAEAAAAWSHRVRVARHDGLWAAGDRYLEVQYERLVAEPREELRRVCDFTQLRFVDEMLDYGEKALQKIPENERHLHGNLVRPPTTGLRDWRGQLSPRDVGTFEAIAGRELALFGYRLDNQNPALRTRIRSRLLQLGNLFMQGVWKARRRALLILRPDALPLPRRW